MTNPAAKGGPVTLPRLVGAAMDLIEAGGVPSVKMRDVAEALGVRAASLYHHVEDKDALLDLVLVEMGARLGPGLVDEFEAVTTLDEWTEVARRASLQAFDFHARHPGLASLLLQRAFDGVNTYPTVSAIARAECDALVRVGMPEAEAYRVYQTCARWALAEIAAETAVAPGPARREVFVDGLEILLRGIRHLLEHPAPTDAGASPRARKRA